jgi:K+-sensing histidine kinase KdpD
MEVINLDYAKVWANLDWVQITLLSLSIIFLLAQGIFAYSSGAIRSRIIKIWVFQTHLPPKFEFRHKKQKYIHLFLIIMFVALYYLVFIRRLNNRTSNLTSQYCSASKLAWENYSLLLRGKTLAISPTWGVISRNNIGVVRLE